MTSDIQFTTDSTPGEQAFERAVDSVTEAIEERFKTTGDSYGARMAGLLRMGVWISLADDGTTSVEDVHDVLTERHSGGDDDPEVRIVCRHLAALLSSGEDTDGGSHE